MLGKDAKAREGEKAMVRRIRRAGVAAALALLLMATPLAGVAYAKIISATPGNDYLLGTTKTDLIRGRGKDDYIRALAGDDLLYGGAGDDVVRGGGGNDKIYARDANSLDTIDCGGGFDKVETIHRDDRTLENCERTLGPRRGNLPPEECLFTGVRGIGILRTSQVRNSGNCAFTNCCEARGD